MMIDTKKLEELISKGNELSAACEVRSSIGDFITVNIERCKRERNYLELQAWAEALDKTVAELAVLTDELRAVNEQIQQMRRDP